MSRDGWLCWCSRLIGYALTGRHVMLCSVAHERGWRIVPVLDALCYVREGERHHCARMAQDDARREQIRARRASCG